MARCGARRCRWRPKRWRSGGKYDAVVALGTVIRGGLRAEYVAGGASVARQRRYMPGQRRAGSLWYSDHRGVNKPSNVLVQSR
ncbi:hypothetical protein KCP74_24550 [Salmonella enterica subsp. enterica]|nr:hypothetical protein KCP74_24550 [Salmonella enterica subsp. enterica]